MPRTRSPAEAQPRLRLNWAPLAPVDRYAVKFRVERDVLAEAVTWVARGVPARPSVPVLAGILIDADAEGSITLSAFDYEVSARITVPADVRDAGTVLVLGRLLSDISATCRPASRSSSRRPATRST